MPSPHRSVRYVAPLTAAAALILGGLTTAPAHAATTATWTAWSGSWSVASNWSTNTVPGPDDTVVIPEIPGHTVDVQGIGDATVADLIVTGGENDTKLGADGAGSLTVTGAMSWTGGTIGVPVSISDGATLAIASGHDKYFSPNGGHLTVAGDATIDSTGMGEGDGLQFWWDSGLVIASGGSLTTHGQVQLTGNRCCSSAFPSALDDGGSLSVPDGKLVVENMGLLVHGEVHVAASALLADDNGVARLGDATYDGGGSLLLSNTSGPAAQPDHLDRNQGGAFLDGTGTLADGFEIQALGGTELTGIGTLTGTGDLYADGATIYAHLRLRGAAYLENPAAGHALLGVYDTTEGYHGDVDLGAGGFIEPSGHLTIHPGARLTVSGRALDVAAQGILDSDLCCSGPPQVVIGALGAVTFHGNGSDAASLMKWLTVRSAGRIDVPTEATWTKDTVRQTAGTTSVGSVLAATGTSFTVAGGSVTDGQFQAGTYRGDLANSGGTVRPGGTLTVDGDYTQGKGGTLAVGSGDQHSSLVVTGTARLAGTLTAATSGTPPDGTTQAVLRAGARTGTFGCAHTGDWLPTYAGRSVSVTMIGVHGRGCEHDAVSTRLSATLKAGQRRAFTSVSGKHAGQVLIRVRLSRASRSTKVTISAVGGGHATVSVGRDRTVTRYLVLRVGTNHDMRALNSSGTVRTQVRELGWYR